jgi:hypothetical protein
MAISAYKLRSIRNAKFESMLKQVFFYFLICIPVISFSQTGGSSTYKFLDLPVSAREASTGGLLLPVKDNDINLSFSNPSLLSSEMNNALTLSYINYFTDINYGYTGYAKSIDSIGTFSAGIKFINYGKFFEADATGLQTGEFKAAEYAFNLGYCWQPDTIFSIGANLKTIYSTLYNYTSMGSAIDVAGTYFNAKKRITATIVIKNIGIEWKPYVKGNRENIPFEIQAGISGKPAHVPFRFSLMFQKLQKWDLTYNDPANPKPTTDPITGEEIKVSRFKNFSDKLGRHLIFGGEFLITKNFHINFGYNYLRRQELKVETKPGLAGFSVGFGMRISKFNISYGRATYNVAGASNHFTISTKLSDFTSKN